MNYLNDYTKEEMERIHRVYGDETRIKRFFMKVKEWMLGEHLI